MMSDDYFARVLGDLTELIKRHLEEKTPPNDIIMALNQASFNMFMCSYEQAQALSKLYPQLVFQDGIKEK